MKRSLPILFTLIINALALTIMFVWLPQTGIQARSNDNTGSLTSSNKSFEMSPGQIDATCPGTVATFISGTDTMIKGKDNDDVNKNYGGDVNIEVEYMTDDLRRALIKWDNITDTTEIPANSTIVSATIIWDFQRDKRNPDKNNYPFPLYSIIRNWVEDEATWMTSTIGSAWGISGTSSTITDRGSTILGYTPVYTSTPYTTTVLNDAGVAQIQAWIDGDEDNNGFIIYTESLTSTTVDEKKFEFTSFNGTVVDERPKLRVCYLRPTAVSLNFFTAVATSPGIIMVEWSTLAEFNTAGFNLYRSTDPNDLSPEHLGYFDSEDPGGSSGADYELKDSNVQAGVIYYYWLEEVITGGGKYPLGATQETGLYGIWLPLGFK